MENMSKVNKRKAFNKDVGPGRNPKLIKIEPTLPYHYYGL